jgi:Flp pilus assembly protein protease CpaA
MGDDGARMRATHPGEGVMHAVVTTCLIGALFALYALILYRHSCTPDVMESGAVPRRRHRSPARTRISAGGAGASAA